MLANKIITKGSIIRGSISAFNGKRIALSFERKRDGAVRRRTEDGGKSTIQNCTRLICRCGVRMNLGAREYTSFLRCMDYSRVATRVFR